MQSWWDGEWYKGTQKDFAKAGLAEPQDFQHKPSRMDSGSAQGKIRSEMVTSRWRGVGLASQTDIVLLKTQ